MRSGAFDRSLVVIRRPPSALAEFRQSELLCLYLTNWLS
jgi:hypothetical protein